MKDIGELLDYGQGDDTAITEILDGFNKLCEGFYQLVNYGDEWWKVLNQNIVTDTLIEEAWRYLFPSTGDTIEKLDQIEIALAGSYIKFDKFVEACKEAYKNGGGYRPEGNKK